MTIPRITRAAWLVAALLFVAALVLRNGPTLSLWQIMGAQGFGGVA